MTLQKERMVVQINQQLEKQGLSRETKASVASFSDSSKTSAKNNQSIEAEASTDLEKTLPKKNAFRIKKTVSIAVGTDDKKTSRPTQAIPQNPLLTQTSSLKLNDLRSREEEASPNAAFLQNILRGRISEDKRLLDQFLEKHGLMKFYDQLWEIGVDSLEGLSKVTFVEFNAMYMTAGYQLKIQKELKNLGICRESETKDMAVTTDFEAPAAPLPRPPAPAPNPSSLKSGKLNFGISLKKAEKTHSVSVGTDSLPGDENMPLNVETEAGPSLPAKAPSSPLPAKRVKFADDPPASPPKPATGAPAFSFAAVGGTTWKNELFVERFGSPESSTQGLSRDPVKKASCYCCFRPVSEDEAFTHRILAGKVASGEPVLLLEQVPQSGV